MTPKEIMAHHDKDNILNYIDKFQSIEALIFDWLEQDQNNSFDLGNGIDDDEQFSLVCLNLKSQKAGIEDSVAELYYDLKEAKAVFGEYPLFESLVSIKEDSQGFTSPFVVDDEANDNFQNSVGFYFDENLYSYACDTKLMIPYLMTFALSAGGGTIVSRTSQNFIDDLGDEDGEIIELDHKKVYFCNSYISHKNHRTCYDYFFIKTT